MSICYRHYPRSAKRAKAVAFPSMMPVIIVLSWMESGRSHLHINHSLNSLV